MAGLVPAIHVFDPNYFLDVDARDKCAGMTNGCFLRSVQLTESATNQI
jgi:hypothetical protein